MNEYAVRIKDVSFGYEDFRYRTPIKFGGVALDRVTILNVDMTVETTGGKVSRGFGSMPLGNVWAWPSKVMSYEQTLAAMKSATEVFANAYRKESVGYSHPIRFGHTIESLLLEWASRQSMPTLAALVVNSAFDAALHDAYGKAFGLNCYHTYGPPFFDDDLGDYLGAEFKGEKLANYISHEPQPSLPLYHLVGALDPLTPAEVKEPVGDGLPEHLGEWITRDGLTHLKIKLNGDDAGWDVARVLNVDRVATATADRQFHYSLDFNERLSERRIPVGCAESGERAVARRVRPHSICGTADGTRSASKPRQPHAPGGRTGAGRDRRIAARPRNSPAGS